MRKNIRFEKAGIFGGGMGIYKKVASRNPFFEGNGYYVVIFFKYAQFEADF